MVAELFFPDDDKQDKRGPIATISIELNAAQRFVELLKDRAEEVTDTDLDLSCEAPYNKYDVVQTILTLHENADIDLGFKRDTSEELKKAEIKNIPQQLLKEYFTAITLSYRQAALNILLGIGIHYKNAEGTLPDLGPSRNTPPEVIDEALVGKIIPVVSTYALIKSGFESSMQGIRLGAAEAWSEMFNDRDHKTLPMKFLERKIDEKTLIQTVTKMPEPTFSHKHK